MKKTTIALLPVIGILLSGCFHTPPADSQQNETVSQDKSEPSPLAMFLESFSQVKSYQATVETSQDDITRTIIIKYLAPSTTHVSVDSEEGLTEIITTSEASYFKASSSQNWLKLSVQRKNEGEEFIFSSNDFNRDFDPENDSLSYIGQTSCGNNTCHTYKSQDENGVITTISFDTTEYLLRQLDINSPEGESTTITYQYIDITINVPEDVEEFAIPENPTPEDIQKLQDIYNTN